MKRNVQQMLLIAIFTLLTACGKSEIPVSHNGGEQETSIVQEVTDDDFIYRLVTEKAEYENGADVTLYAELEYVGEKDSIKIYHAASPFHFHIKELTRHYSLDYAMNQPLLETVLTKGEPLREDYQSSGSYSEFDDKEYVQFLEEFWKTGHLPDGEYEVAGKADFFVYEEDKEEEKKDYQIKAEVSFKVR